MVGVSQAIGYFQPWVKYYRNLLMSTDDSNYIIYHIKEKGGAMMYISEETWHKKNNEVSEAE